MKEETFRKVWIKSEEDLPDEGTYFVRYNDGHCADALDFVSNKYENLWMHDVDWYLQPISQPEQEQNDIQLFMDDIHKWADDTFGTERTSIAPLHHLQKEVEETIKAMKQGIRENTLIELADCFILILNASSKYRVTFAELLKVSRNKMEINKSRKWGKPDSNGVCEHIREVHPSTEQSVEITEMFDEIESIVWFENKSQRLKFDAIKAKWLRDKIKSKDTITTKDLNEIDKAREEKLTLEDQIREMLKKMKISSLW